MTTGKQLDGNQLGSASFKCERNILVKGLDGTVLGKDEIENLGKRELPPCALGEKER